MAEQDLRGQILLQAGLINNMQLDKALEEQKKTGERIGQCLIRLNFIKEKDMMLALEEQFGISWQKITEQDVQRKAVDLVPENLVFTYEFMPLKDEKGILTIALADPLSYESIDDIKLVIERELEFVLATEEEIKILIEKFYKIKLK